MVINHNTMTHRILRRNTVEKYDIENKYRNNADVLNLLDGVGEVFKNL